MRPTMKTGLLAGLLMASTVTAIAGEAELAPGSKVQVLMTKGVRIPGLDPPRRRFTGKLVASDDKVFTVARDGQPDLLLAREDVARLQVRRRSTSGQSIGAGAKKGAIIGAVTGVAVALPLGLAFCGGGWCRDGEVALGTATGAVVFGAVGGVLGVIGGAVHRGERWETVSPRRPQLSLDLAPARRGAGVAVRYAF
jgi:hypothetical protein